MLGLGMSAVPSKLCGYIITSALLCFNLECKGFVLGPGLSAASSNVGGYSITS